MGILFLKLLYPLKNGDFYFQWSIYAFDFIVLRPNHMIQEMLRHHYVIELHRKRGLFHATSPPDATYRLSAPQTGKFQKSEQ